jgi:hypothetical protein
MTPHKRWHPTSGLAALTIAAVMLSGCGTVPDAAALLHTNPLYLVAPRAVPACYLQLHRSDLARAAKRQCGRDEPGAGNPSATAGFEVQVGYYSLHPAGFDVVVEGENHISGRDAIGFGDPGAADCRIAQEPPQRAPHLLSLLMSLSWCL